MAETQAMQTHVGAHNNGTGVTFAAPTGPGSRAGQHAPRQPSTSNGLGGSSPPLTFNILSDSAVQVYSQIPKPQFLNPLTFNILSDSAVQVYSLGPSTVTPKRSK
jgi:hypothetical protein